MGCAASAEGTQQTNNSRPDDSPSKHEDKKPTVIEVAPATDKPKDQPIPAAGKKTPDSSRPISPPSVHTIAGYPVNTYTDGNTRVAVRCVILSRQKCESVCRFLDSVRKVRDRSGGYFRNPEEPIEAPANRDTDTASAASAKSKFEPSVSAIGGNNSSVTGHMNVSMAVHAGGPTDIHSPGPQVHTTPQQPLAVVPEHVGNHPVKVPEKATSPSPPPLKETTVVASPTTKDNGEPIPGSVDVDGAM
eukprot:GDKK01037296.1.p1 GENE.GDKK01037296.1~~GDKK01037296.1.p1  ORF type:complete len:246 (-),score=1.86 GDKK01037296.1:232-969(-)